VSSVYADLAAAAAVRPHHPAVVDRAGALTYREVDVRVRRLAGALRGLGIGRGDVVSFQLPNWAEALVVHHATLLLGAVSNPIVPIYRTRELGYILERSRSKVLFVPWRFRGTDHLELARGLGVAGLSVVVVDKDGERPPLRAGERLLSELLEAAPVDREVFAPSDDEVALLLYTSGTTARPKGVLHTHATLRAENRTIAERYALGRDDVVFMASPVTHITGVLYALQLPALLHGTAVLQDIWDPGRAARLIAEHRATFTVGATPFLRGLVAEGARLPLRAFACGGADVPAELVREASQVLGCFVTRVYGSSEHPTVTACGHDDPLEKAATTDGRAMPGSEVRVLYEQGRDVAPGEAGELAVRGPERFRGYLDPDDDNGAFLAGGWFMTGDLGRLDADGYLRIEGRLKDIIIRGGENISVKEVEELLAEHPAVAEVAVVAMPDPELGEKGCAFVVPAGDEPPGLDALVAFLLEHGLAKQKLPERLELIDALPTTASGKVQRFRLKERLAAAPATSTT
jgi:cyclohexanecarboxylate-CoA ligase